MNLHGNKIVLRALEVQDMPFLREMINDPEMEKMVVGWSFPVSEKQQLDWYNRIIGDNINIRFAIEYENRFVGVSTLTHIDWKNRAAHQGIKLCKDTPKGKGIGTEAVMVTMKYAFEELQLNRLYGSILEYNIASQKLYTKCGWKIEGTYRQSVFKNNEYHDELAVSILRGEYFDLIQKQL